MLTTANILTAGSALTESPRWHAGTLWYVDVPTHRLRTVDLDGNDELVEEFEDRLQAVDFLPDGTPVVALGFSKQIIRLSDHSVYADLSQLENKGMVFHKLNDMIIDGRGRLYVDITMARQDGHRPHEDLGDAIAVVEPNGDARLATTTSSFLPNGMAVTPDGSQLISAELPMRRLISYAIGDDGVLTDAQLFAELPEGTSDGICTDSEGAIWTSTMEASKAIRIHQGGEVSESVAVEGGHHVIATMLGGPTLQHLFIATCAPPDGRLMSWEDACGSQGFIQVAEVAIPGGGWPAAVQ